MTSPSLPTDRTDLGGDPGEPVPAALSERTVDQLVEASGELDQQLHGVFDRLGRITGQAADDRHGVSVEVTLEGMLVGLDLSPAALDQPAADLAALIFRLTQQASAAALADGLDTLAPIAGENLTAELTELVGLAELTEQVEQATIAAKAAEAEKASQAKSSQTAPPQAPARPRRPTPEAAPENEDDFSTIQTWALRD